MFGELSSLVGLTNMLDFYYSAKGPELGEEGNNRVA